VPHLNGENNNNKHRVIHVRHKIVGEMRIDIYICRKLNKMKIDFL
jgi:hypothetical protein